MAAQMNTTGSISLTPRQLMEDYTGLISGELIVRLLEQYTNDEVEERINKTRPTPIKNPNFHAARKRYIETIALRDGYLPTEWRLMFDKVRLHNLEARFGSNHTHVKFMRKNIAAREALPTKQLPAVPSLKQLEDARPENGQKPQKSRETRDYWYKFLAATEAYDFADIKKVYKMADTTARDEIKRCVKIVKRMKEVEKMEQEGQTIEQTYVPAPLLQPAPVVPNTPANLPSAVPQKRKRGSTKKSATPTKMEPLLLSVFHTDVLRRLERRLEANPAESLPAFATLKKHFEPYDLTDEDDEWAHWFYRTCETDKTLARFVAWYQGAEGEAGREEQLLETYGAARVGTALWKILTDFRESVFKQQNAGKKRLAESFLCVLMRRLGDLEQVEADIKGAGVAEEQAMREIDEEDDGHGGRGPPPRST